MKDDKATVPLRRRRSQTRLGLVWGAYLGALFFGGKALMQWHPGLTGWADVKAFIEIGYIMVPFLVAYVLRKRPKAALLAVLMWIAVFIVVVRFYAPMR